MTTPEDTRAQVLALGEAVREMRSALARLEDVRDAAIRRLASDPDVNRAELARDLGLARSRLYAILEPAITRDEDGDVVDVDLERLDLADALWDEAIRRWEEAGSEGDPDDHFPLEAALAER